MEERILRNIQKFSKRVHRDRFAKVYAPLADSYRRVGLFEDAVNSCQTGLQIFPRYLACHEVLGRVFLRQSRLADAKRELETVYKVVSDSLELNKALVKVYVKTSENEKAKPLLRELTAKDPFDFEMRNMLAHIERQEEAAKARKDAIDRGEDPDELDIYDLAERQDSLVDIQSIINADKKDRAFDTDAIIRATDDALDNLENLEETIDTEADRIADRAQEDDGKKKPVETERKRKRRLRQELHAEGLEEISAAAVIAQIELELSLLDEAALLCKRLLKAEPKDEELKKLADKFNQRLEEKEEELEKLENLNLARGL